MYRLIRCYTWATFLCNGKPLQGSKTRECINDQPFLAKYVREDKLYLLFRLNLLCIYCQNGRKLMKALVRHDRQRQRQEFNTGINGEPIIVILWCLLTAVWQHSIKKKKTRDRPNRYLPNTAQKTHREMSVLMIW